MLVEVRFGLAKVEITWVESTLYFYYSPVLQTIQTKLQREHHTNSTDTSTVVRALR